MSNQPEKVKVGFLSKAYILAFCDSQGEFSITKTVVCVGVIAYIAFINPIMLVAMLEIMLIFGLGWFLFRLFFGEMTVAAKSP